MKTKSRHSKLTLHWITAALFCSLMSSCIFETDRAFTPRKVALAGVQYDGPKPVISVGNVHCHASHRKSADPSRIESQARVLLLTHLKQTGRFRIIENPVYGNHEQAVEPESKYVIYGDVVEFGRNRTADWELWGLLSSGRRQIAYAKVNLLVINKQTSHIEYSTQGEGRYKLHTRDYDDHSFGGRADFDSVLSGKVVDLAIVEAIDRLSESLISGTLKL